MKTTSRFFSIALMAVLSTITMYAQTYDWEKAPKYGEKVIGYVTTTEDAGFLLHTLTSGTFLYTGTRDADERVTKTKEELYECINKKARLEYGSKYPAYSLRNFKSTVREEPPHADKYANILISRADRKYIVSATVVVKEEPKPEPSKTKSQEDEGTALNHLVVHFDVISRPQGADVEWRVISKTPEVKNTNYKYLQTTPYESTETLTINGLTFNNSGLVQIEIKVSKNGYYPQTKKYNVRSIIDEKEVSGIYRLIKEE